LTSSSESFGIFNKRAIRWRMGRPEAKYTLAAS
jgi:hypothetical protein